MDRRSRPYFHGFDRSLNFQQKEALAQGILQVIETIPDGFESFEFQFTEQKVHIYKLGRGMILLVLTHDQLVDADYLTAIASLKLALQGEMADTIATLRQVAGGSTLSGLSYRKPVPLTPLTPLAPLAPLAPLTPLAAFDHKTLSLDITPAKRHTVADLVAALNHLSQFTSQYLGTHVIVNYWKATRPSDDWLPQLQVDRSAQFSLPDFGAEALGQGLTRPQQEWVQIWIAAFIKRCALVIRDFAAIVEQKALDDRQKALLLGKK